MTTHRPSVAHQVISVNEELATHAPAEVLAAFVVEQADLDAAVSPLGPPGPAPPCPTARCSTRTAGPPASLRLAATAPPWWSSLEAPGAPIATSPCGPTYQADLLPELARRGVTLIAVSPRKPNGSFSTRQTNALDYPVLSDPGNQIAAVLGVLTAPTPDARASQVALGLEISTANADGTHTVPMPTTVLVDAAGVIRWIDIHPNYTTRSEVADILSALDRELTETTA